MFHLENLQFCFRQGYLQRMDGIFEYLEKHTCWSHLNIKKKKKRNLCLCFLGDTYETMNDEWYIIMYGATVNRASVVAQLVKNPPAMQEIWVWSLGWEDTLEKGIAYALQYSVHRGKSHGDRSLVGYSPWSHRELDMTERLTLSLSRVQNYF